MSATEVPKALTDGHSPQTEERWAPLVNVREVPGSHRVRDRQAHRRTGMKRKVELFWVEEEGGALQAQTHPPWPAMPPEMMGERWDRLSPQPSREPMSVDTSASAAGLLNQHGS